VPRRLLILVCTLFEACATQQPVAEQPELITDEREISLEMIRQMLDCAADRAPVCLEKMGKPYRCFCADRDTMRRALEPDRFP